MEMPHMHIDVGMPVMATYQLPGYAPHPAMLQPTGYPPPTGMPPPPTGMPMPTHAAGGGDPAARIAQCANAVAAHAEGVRQRGRRIPVAPSLAHALHEIEMEERHGRDILASGRKALARLVRDARIACARGSPDGPVLVAMSEAGREQLTRAAVDFVSACAQPIHLPPGAAADDAARVAALERMVANVHSMAHDIQCVLTMDGAALDRVADDMRVAEVAACNGQECLSAVVVPAERRRRKMKWYIIIVVVAVLCVLAVVITLAIVLPITLSKR